jgi:hypothetical protein
MGGVRRSSTRSDIMAELFLQLSAKENEAPLPNHSVPGLMFGAWPSVNAGKKGKKRQQSA